MSASTPLSDSRGFHHHLNGATNNGIAANGSGLVGTSNGATNGHHDGMDLQDEKKITVQALDVTTRNELVFPSCIGGQRELTIRNFKAQCLRRLHRVFAVVSPPTKKKEEK